MQRHPIRPRHLLVELVGKKRSKSQGRSRVPLAPEVQIPTVSAGRRSADEGRDREGFLLFAAGTRPLAALSSCIVFVPLFTGACFQQDESFEPQGANEAVLIDGDPLCPECRIVFQDVVTLGGDDDPASVWQRAAGLGCMVAELGTGEFVLGGVAGGGEVFVYDAQGRFTRTLGKRGEGPGELSGTARLLTGAGDTLWVADAGNVRMQAWTANGEHISSFRIPAPYRSFIRLDDGSWVFDGAIDAVGEPMYWLLGPDGEALGRIGLAQAPEPDLERGVLARRSQPPNGFWSASIWSYAIEEWDAPDAPVRTLVRDVPWFPPYPPFTDDVYESVPPPPGLHHIREDHRGHLWVYVLLPDQQWRPGIPLSPRPNWYRETFDLLIEVIDPVSARLLVSDTHENRLAPVCNSDLVYSVVEVLSGDLRVRVMKPLVVDSAGAPWR